MLPVGGAVRTDYAVDQEKQGSNDAGRRITLLAPGVHRERRSRLYFKGEPADAIQAVDKSAHAAADARLFGFLDGLCSAMDLAAVRNREDVRRLGRLPLFHDRRARLSTAGWNDSVDASEPSQAYLEETRRQGSQSEESKRVVERR